MILVTYQPTNAQQVSIEESPMKKALKERLGSTPKWCFAANSVRELVRNSTVYDCDCVFSMVIICLHKRGGMYAATFSRVILVS